MNCEDKKLEERSEEFDPEYYYWIENTLKAYQVLIDEGIDFSRFKKELESWLDRMTPKEIDFILANEGLWMTAPWISYNDIVRVLSGWNQRGLYDWTCHEDLDLIHKAYEKIFKTTEDESLEEN